MDFYSYSLDSLRELGDGLVGRVALLAKPDAVIESTGTPLGDLLDEGRIVSVMRDVESGPVTSVMVVPLDEADAAPREWVLAAVLGLANEGV